MASLDPGCALCMQEHMLMGFSRPAPTDIHVHDQCILSLHCSQVNAASKHKSVQHPSPDG